MPNDKLAELERRLALADREMERMCAQLRALKAQTPRRWQSWRDKLE